jgi:polyferredoxin
MRRYQAFGRRESEVEDTLAKIVEESDYGRKAWIKNFTSVVGIFLIGMVGWTMAWQTGMWEPAPLDKKNGSEEAIGGLVLGYFSALCYLG